MLLSYMIRSPFKWQLGTSCLHQVLIDSRNMFPVPVWGLYTPAVTICLCCISTRHKCHNPLCRSTVAAARVQGKKNSNNQVRLPFSVTQLKYALCCHDAAYVGCFTGEFTWSNPQWFTHRCRKILMFWAGMGAEVKWVDSVLQARHC